MQYQELLKKAMENLPKNKESDRIEIPKPDISYSGKRTVLKNFSSIAKVMRRDPKHFAKFLFKTLAVPGNFDKELVLQGKINRDILKKRIDEYLKIFVICHECGKYDTKMEKRGNLLIIKCEACGARKTMG